MAHRPTVVLYCYIYEMGADLHVKSDYVKICSMVLMGQGDRIQRRNNTTNKHSETGLHFLESLLLIRLVLSCFPGGFIHFTFTGSAFVALPCQLKMIESKSYGTTLLRKERTVPERLIICK